MTASLRILSSKAELHKEWTEAGVSASRVTTLRRLQEKGYQATSETETSSKHLTWLRRKITGLLLSGPKSSFQMRVYFAFHLEIKVPESGGRCRGTESMLLEVQCKFPQSVMIWAAMSSAGVGPLCFLKSTVNAVVMGSSDSDLRVLFSKMNKSFFEFISFFLAKHNSNVTCYFPNTSTTYANVDHTTNNTKL